MILCTVLILKGRGFWNCYPYYIVTFQKSDKNLLLSRNEIVSKFPSSVYPLFHRSESHMLACHPLILGYLRVNIFKNLDLHTCKSGYVIFLLSDLIYFWSCYLLGHKHFWVDSTAVILVALHDKRLILKFGCGCK